MERLTKRESANVGGRELVLCNYKKEDCNDSCMYESGCKWQHKALRKLKEYEDLEEQGLLLQLPCKVGDVVYQITRDFISEFKIKTFVCDGKSFFFHWQCIKGIYVNVIGFHSSRIGKDVFLTKEEAKQALAKMKGGQNE